MRRQRRVAHRRIDGLVTEIVLDRPRVLAIVGELITAGMPQHVAENEEWEARGLAGPSNHALKPATLRGARRSETNT
jgi:hypothetical protein